MRRHQLLKALCATGDACLGLVVTVIIAVLTAQVMFGSTVLAVTSGSMAPALQVGDAIVTSEVDPSTIDVGDVIIFRPNEESAVVVT
ncbi:MAG: S26 family signal peptidase, partial [Actinomycetota bacterium]|nr:S26 family signal peptidase [Actinomycetota bacterium]